MPQEHDGTARDLKSEFLLLEPDEALREAPTALLSVSSSAATALEPLGIRTVFDLAVSRIFATANALILIQRDPTAAEARLNAVANDAVDPPPGVPVSELADQSIAILRGIGSANVTGLRAALDVTTVRDLALWPGHLAAKRVLDQAYFPDKIPGFDRDAPAELLPRAGVYPTERVFFRKLVLDAVAPAGATAEPIEQAEAIDLTTALATPGGFQRLATGALLTFSQSWFAQGLTLGQLLHSTSLAPGESTRIAMIDWSRRTRAETTESITETEQLSNTMIHNRAMSEVTQSTARDFEAGRSTSSTTSTTGQAGGSFGLDLGPLAIGGSGGVSTSTTDVLTTSSSFGARDLAASYAQDINDRTQQNASSARNRRASIVREVSQTEHEQISTRMVTNYNHMHALSIQYYEVVQAFRTTTMLERAEKCLFVPLRLLNFTDQTVVDRWRVVLADAALTPQTRRQLTVEYGVVEVIPQTPRITPGRLTAIAVRPTVMARAAAPPTSGGEEPTPDPEPAPRVDYRRAPVTSAAAVLSNKGWDPDQLNAIGWATGRVLARRGSDSVFVSDDALVIGLSLREGQAARFAAHRRDGTELTPEHTSPSAFVLGEPVALKELQSIAIQFTGDQELRTGMVLQLSVSGTVFPLDVPIAVRPMSVPQDVVKFGAVTAARELMDHLQANATHYSQAVFRSLDGAAVGSLLGRYTYRGLPLGQVVDTQPIAVSTNFLVFRLNLSPEGHTHDGAWAAEENEWRTWLEQHGLMRPAPRTEIIPLPSGGVFAEAVLGRYNAAEKVDLTRFWNWQDSPIPLVAPEIAPLQAGSRAQAEDLRPGQLSQPVLSIQAPTALPDPTGVGAILTAIQNGNMFRDMSGLAQNAALAQAALQATAQGATAVGQQAGTNMKTVVDAQTERMRIAAQLAAAAMGIPAGGNGSAPGKDSVTERGGELNAAQGIDEIRGPATNNGSGGVGAVEPEEGEEGEDVTNAPMPLLEETFRNQLAGGAAGSRDMAARFADKVMEGIGGDLGEDDIQLAQVFKPKAKKLSPSKVKKKKSTSSKSQLSELKLEVQFRALGAVQNPAVGLDARVTITDDSGKTILNKAVPDLIAPIKASLKNVPDGATLHYAVGVRLSNVDEFAAGTPDVSEDLGVRKGDVKIRNGKTLIISANLLVVKRTIVFDSVTGIGPVLKAEHMAPPRFIRHTPPKSIGGGDLQADVFGYFGDWSVSDVLK